MRTLALLLAALSCGRAADIPLTLVSDDEAESIHSAIVRREAWTQASVRSLRREAEARMRDKPWSVTAVRPKVADLDPHEYFSEAPPPPGPTPFDSLPATIPQGPGGGARFTANRAALYSASDAIFTLGAAAYLLDEPRYARRAARLVRVWFLDPKTRMNPGLDHAQTAPGGKEGGTEGVLEGRVLIRAMLGMEFLAYTDRWRARDQAQVRQWFVEYLRWLLHSETGMEARRAGMPVASWWAAQVAATAGFVGDGASEQIAFSFFRDRLLARVTGPGRDEGGLPPHFASTLEAIAIICRVARVHGNDLWNARTRGGQTIAAAFDPFLNGRRKWSREVTDFPGEGPVFLAFGGMGLKRPDYVELYRKVDRSEAAWPSLVDLLLGRSEAAAHQTPH